jgi:hypothetical protein
MGDGQRGQALSATGKAARRYGVVIFTVTAGEVTVVLLVPGADAVAFTVSGAFVGDRLLPLTRKAWPVQVAPVVLLIPDSVALLASANAHVAVLLMSVPVGEAIACRQNGMPPPADTDCDDGVTAIDVTPFNETVMLAEPLTVTLVAVIVAEPTPMPVTSPLDETVAMVWSLVVHEAFPVMSFCVPSS